MEEQDDGGFDVVLKELITLHEDASKSKDNNHRSGLDLILRELITQRERAAVATERLQQQDVMTKQQNDFQLRLQKQQEEFMAKLEQEKREHQVQIENHQERLEQERREHNLKQDKLLARQDELIARHDQERVEAKASQEVLLHKILDNQRNLPPRDENQEGVILEQGRQQIYFREVIQQLQEEVKTLRHSESGKSKNCQGRVMLKQPGDANRFRSSFDSIHSWRS